MGTVLANRTVGCEERVMQRAAKVFLTIILVLLTISGQTAESGPPAVGGVLPEFLLPVPPDSHYRGYLGVDGKPKFKVTDIDADVLIIQIFSMY